MIRVLAVLARLASPARAGLFCDDKTAIGDLEAWAKSTAAKDKFDHDYSALCLQSGDAKLAARVEKACTTILDRDGDKDNACVTIAAVYGFSKLGEHDIFADVSAYREDPIEAAGGVGYYRCTRARSSIARWRAGAAGGRTRRTRWVYSAASTTRAVSTARP